MPLGAAVVPLAVTGKGELEIAQAELELVATSFEEDPHELKQTQIKSSAAAFKVFMYWGAFEENEPLVYRSPLELLSILRTQFFPDILIYIKYQSTGC